MWQPWVGHYFPAYTSERMIDLSWPEYVAMWDFIK